MAGARIVNSSDQASSSITDFVDFSTTDFDPSTMFTTTYPRRLTAYTTGNYAVGTHFFLEGLQQGKTYAVGIRKSGSYHLAERLIYIESATTKLAIPVSTVHRFIQGEYAEIYITHDASTNPTVKAYQGSPIMWMVALTHG